MFAKIEVIMPSFSKKTGEWMIGTNMFNPAFEDNLMEVKSHSAVFWADVRGYSGSDSLLDSDVDALLDLVKRLIHPDYHKRFLWKATKETFYVFITNGNCGCDVKAGAHVQDLASNLFN